MSVKIMKCKWCGNLFQSTGKDMCAKCIEKLDRDFVAVRDYLYDYPNSSMNVVVEETGVDQKSIDLFLKQGRIMMSAEFSGIICQDCGTPISSGTLCGSCKEKLKGVIGQVSGAAEKAKKKETTALSDKKNERMHINKG